MLSYAQMRGCKEVLEALSAAPRAEKWRNGRVARGWGTTVGLFDQAPYHQGLNKMIIE